MSVVVMNLKSSMSSQSMCGEGTCEDCTHEVYGRPIGSSEG